MSFLYSLFSFCRTLSGTLGCMRRFGTKNLIPLDQEIKKTLKRILKGKREATIMEQQLITAQIVMFHTFNTMF